MSWKTFHHRGEILRSVISAANDRCDGLLPTDVPGVSENFADELDLVGALLLKWNARLSGNIELALLQQPLDLESAVAGAWRATAEQMPGVRLVIDAAAEHPEGPEMDQAMRRARDHEWARLATAAGLANIQDSAAVVAGRRIEDQAREGLAAPMTVEVAEEVAVAGQAAHTPAARVVPSAPAETASLADRIKAVLAA